MSSPNYQLTKHPTGSILEVWAMSWPLMLGLISNSLMMFIDRLVLSWHSADSLSAGANAAMAYYLFLVIPMSICAISEVLVGRLHGEGKLSEIGKPVWQTIWFAFLLAVPFMAIALWAPPLMFYQSANQTYETSYFQILICFAPFMCATIALSGFFIGTGHVKFVTAATIVGNVFNGLAGYLLIFGYGPIPAMGVAGAALATGLAQVVQFSLLMAFFLAKSNRRTYGTTNARFNEGYFKEALHIGTPSGAGHAVEVLAHFLFFRIVMMAGSQYMVVVALVQSFYLLFSFVIEAQSKGVSSIIANLIGARVFSHIHHVFKAAIKLHSMFFVLFASLMLFFPESLLGLFASGEEAIVLTDPVLRKMAIEALLWMSLFFLFDGFSWILIGHLTAAGDTKFIFYVSSIINWVAYVVPAFFIIGLGKQGADVAWQIIALYSMLNFAIYLWRYQSGRWLDQVTVAKDEG